MDKDLINARAHGELHKTLLKELFAAVFQIQEEQSRILEASSDSDDAYRPTRKSKLNGLKCRVERNIRETSFSLQQVNGEEIRQTELLFARQFFDELSDRLPEDNLLPEQIGPN